MENLSEKEPYIVFSSGGKNISYWRPYKKTKTFKNISMALAGPTGVSGGSASRIPRLLIDASRSFFLDRIKINNIEEDKKDGVKLYKINGVNRYFQPMIIWVDRKYFLFTQNSF